MSVMAAGSAATAVWRGGRREQERWMERDSSSSGERNDSKALLLYLFYIFLSMPLSSYDGKQDVSLF